jgi:hypothetical protein
MYTRRQSQIVNLLFDFQGGIITHQQLNTICKDQQDKHFAIGKLRGLNIKIANGYRTQSFGDKANRELKLRKDLEKELTIQRCRERQHKELLRSN